MSDLILTLNAGSSSLKFALFEASPGYPERLRGQVERLGRGPRLVCESYGERFTREFAPDEAPADATAALDWVWELAREASRGERLKAVAHRVVHGGPDHAGPARIDEALIETLLALSPLAPLHQPHNLAVVRAARERAGEATHVACFDTAFHRGRDAVSEAFALPYLFYEEGVRRYGFHGLSYASIMDRLRRVKPELARGRLIVAHLGAGCSMAAIADGKSVATTMGFSALEGLPMGTRTGQIDPGVLLWLMRERGYDADALEDLLYRRSGLLGLSGVSADVRDLEASAEPRARMALDLFVNRCAAAIGALTAELRGVHGVVFTAGIGENAAELRGRIVEACGWLGVRLDPRANAEHALAISTPDSPVQALVVRTDEERRMAEEAGRLIDQAVAA